jgi:hypothetical protein
MLNVKRSAHHAQLEQMEIVLPKQLVLRQLHHKDVLLVLMEIVYGLKNMLVVLLLELVSNIQIAQVYHGTQIHNVTGFQATAQLMDQNVLVLLYAQKLTLMVDVSMDMMELVFNLLRPLIQLIQQNVMPLHHVIKPFMLPMMIVKRPIPNVPQVEQGVLL